VRGGAKVGLGYYHTVVTEVDIGSVAIVQPLERARNVNVEVEVVLVFGPVYSLEISNDILMNVFSERLRGLDLVIGGRVESKDLSSSGYDLHNSSRGCQ
jgi:hypothetical protein